MSLQLEQLARQRMAELASLSRRHATSYRQTARPRIRNEAGWMLVAIGLRLAESGRRSY